MPWRQQVCIAKCFYAYRDDLPKKLGKTTAHYNAKSPLPVDVRRSKASDVALIAVTPFKSSSKKYWLILAKMGIHVLLEKNISASSGRWPLFTWIDLSTLRRLFILLETSLIARVNTVEPLFNRLLLRTLCGQNRQKIAVSRNSIKHYLGLLIESGTLQLARLYLIPLIAELSRALAHHGYENLVSYASNKFRFWQNCLSVRQSIGSYVRHIMLADIECLSFYLKIQGIYELCLTWNWASILLSIDSY